MSFAWAEGSFSGSPDIIRSVLEGVGGGLWLLLRAVASADLGVGSCDGLGSGRDQFEGTIRQSLTVYVGGRKASALSSGKQRQAWMLVQTFCTTTMTITSSMDMLGSIAIRRRSSTG